MRRSWLLVLMVGIPSLARADFNDGVSDDRLHLPAGPGSLQGVGDNVSINTNMGVMAHHVALDLPAGFPGATPALGLSYSSSGKSGEVGIGWSLPVDTVERMTSRALPRYSAQDDFAADGGDELVLVDTQPSGAVYRARFEQGFVRWIWHAPGAEGYWEAQYPDGRKGFFGADRAGTLVATARVAGLSGTFRYHLVETVDPLGHRVRYDYTQTPSGYALLKKVSWLFYDDAGGKSRYAVQLGYESRPDVISDAQPGNEIRLDQRLRSLDVMYNGPAASERIRGYTLAYDDSTGLSQLARVQQFGLNDSSNAKPYPIAHSFAYTQSIGAQSGRSLVSIAQKLTGAAVSSGKAQLIDLNGDGLPDVVDSSQPGAHQIWLAQLASDGSESFVGPLHSAVGTSTAFPLDSPRVTPLDVNGDGFTDLVNGNSLQVLINDGSGDWSKVQSFGAGLPDLAGASIRFYDYDGDKKIDILSSDGTTTTVFRNKGDGTFEKIDTVDNLGVAFAGANVQMADMNGDGLLDVVVVESGDIKYRLNLGYGHWSKAGWITVTFPDIQATDFPFLLLEDINGDALSDIVLAGQGFVQLALNKNGTSFGNVQTIMSVGGTPIAERTALTTVVSADMNGNGSHDVVWIDDQGKVQYLELFATRPNLITRIENGIGHVQDITYASSVIQMARAREAGKPWKYRVPFAMTLVDQLDDWDRLTNVHELTQYQYRDGFYDGVEKQYRGQAHVEARLVGDASQEEGLMVEDYDIGAADAYLHGLLLKQATFSGGRLLSEVTRQYQKCPVELEVSSPQLAFPIWHACEIDERTAHVEGGNTPVTTEVQTAYDGFGNVIKVSELGVVDGCAATCTRPSDAFGEACGQGCLGDERFSETQYVPRAKTNGAWMVHAPYREISYGKAGGLTAEKLTYYDTVDGMPFVGRMGELTQGLVTRVTVKTSDKDAPIASSRVLYDANGQVTDTLDPNGTPGDMNNHRRHFQYDSDGLRPIEVDVLLTDGAANPYQLQRKVRNDERFNAPIWATAWMRAQGKSVSGENASSFEYDSFGRLRAIHRPDPSTGLPAQSPTQWFTYDLRDPGSKLISYSTLNGEHATCVDGRGRTYQERTRVADGKYQVTGFSVFNKQSEIVEAYQPSMSASADCDVAPPTGVKSTRHRYDAAHRLIETTLPDGAIYPTPSRAQTSYLPLERDELDAMDTDPKSPFANTPTIQRFDGLGRLIAIGRTLTAGQPASFFTVTYDELGRVQGYVDAAGNRKRQQYDLAGRVVQIDDPNSGTTTLGYDAAGKVVSRTDARGATVKMAYDGADRLAQRWDDANHDATLARFIYDQDPACAGCANTAGRLAGTTYPDGKDNFGYDVRGRAIYSARVLEGFTFETGNSYDDRDRLTSVSYPGGRTLARRYDDAGRLTGIDSIISAVLYDERGMPIETDYANGTKETKSFDDVMRLSAQSLAHGGDVLQSLGYERDRVGNILSVADLSADPTLSQLAATFHYDAWYRVTQAKVGAETLSYQFDALDNVTSAISSAGASSLSHVGDYQYDPKRPNAVTQAGALALQYDAAGNVTHRGDRAQTWDALGRLAAATLPDGDATYKFDSAQERVLSMDPHGVTHHVASDFETQDGLGVIYVRVGGSRVARWVSTDLAAKVYSDLAPLDGPDGQINAGDAWISHAAAQGILSVGGTPTAEDRLLLSSARRLLYEVVPQSTWFGHDQLGSITIETDDKGQVIGRRAYSSFGAVRASTGDADRYGFTGQESDATGAVHFAFRQLDPALGRWASADPQFGVVNSAGLAHLGESTTAYAYVANNPQNYVDPTGLMKAAKELKQVKHELNNKKMDKATMNRKIQAAEKKYGAKMEKEEQRAEETDSQRFGRYLSEQTNQMGIKVEHDGRNTYVFDDKGNINDTHLHLADNDGRIDLIVTFVNFSEEGAEKDHAFGRRDSVKMTLDHTYEELEENISKRRSALGGREDLFQGWTAWVKQEYDTWKQLKE